MVILKSSWNIYHPVDRKGDLYGTAIRTSNPRSKEPFGPKDPLENARQRETVDIRPPLARKSSTGGYQYKLTVKNSGAKIITAIGWDYTFIDAVERKEIARHRFRSEKRIKPGKQRRLTEFTTAQPVGVIDARTLDAKGKHRPFTERVTINYVEYADGSVWRRS